MILVMEIISSLSVPVVGGMGDTARVHLDITPLEEVRNRNVEVSFKGE